MPPTCVDPPRAVRALIPLVLVLASLTCSRDMPTDGTPQAPGVDHVVVTPPAADGAVGQSVQFSAAVLDAAGAELPGEVVQWSTTNPSVVTVAPSGTATAGHPGIAWVIAVAGGKIATAEVTVPDSSSGGDPGSDGGGDTGSSGGMESVTPVASALVVGGTEQLQAIVRNLLGVIIGGLTTAWTTSDTTVATVGPSGVVTAVAPGVATITASTLGLVAASVVTVVDSGPVPSPWPHAPPALPILSDEAFDLLTPSSWVLTLPATGLVSNVLDTTAPESAPAVLQYTYPAGFIGGQAPGTEHHGLGGARQVYAGMWWRTNAEWQGHNSNVNKLAFLYLDRSGGDLPLVFYGLPGGPYELRVALQLRNADPRFWLVPNVAHVPVTMGTWHRTEWQVEYNTTTSPPNGIVRWWLDGTLVGEYTDVLFPADPLVEFQISPTWGGIGDVKTSTDVMLIDHLYLAGR